MRKQLSCVLFTCLTIFGLVLVDAVHLGVVQASTPVTGVIASDTTWTKANSPYSFTGAVLVDYGVTLTIEAGTTVNLNSFYIQVNGTLVAEGGITDADRITFVGGNTGSGSGNYAIKFTQFSTDWNAETGTGCIISGAVLSYTAIGIEKSSPRIVGNDIYGVGITVNTALQGQPIIENNTIHGVSNYGSLNGVYCNGNAIVANNVVGDWPQTGIRVYYGNPLIVGNLIYGSNGLANAGDGGIRVDYRIDYGNQTKPTIENNTIVGNNVGINIVGSAQPIIHGNSIFDNTYNVYLHYDITYGIYPGGGSADATSNWWGTTDPAAINQTLYDHKNDFNLGTVNFIPFLTEPNPTAPPSTIPNPSPTTYPTPVSTPNPQNTPITQPSESPNPSDSPSPTPNPSPTPTPQTAQISISVDAQSASVGSAVYVSGKLADAGGNPLVGETVILSYAIAGDVTYFPVGSSITDSGGNYHVQWVNTASGAFSLQVNWRGNDAYQGASNSTTLSFLPVENQNVFLVESNSTVASLGFNSTTQELSFTVSGESGTEGYVKATIARSLISDAENVRVYLDGNQLTYTLTSSADAWLLTFTYTHSTHQVRVSMTANTLVAPSEGTDTWVLILAAVAVAVVAALVAVAIMRRKRTGKQETH